MKAIVVTDQAAGTAGMKLVERPEPPELRHHRTDCAGRAVREDALPRLKAAVLEQSLPTSLSSPIVPN